MIDNAPGFFRHNFRMILCAVLLASSFVAGIFFSGFDKPYFAPSLILIAVIALIALFPGFRKGWSFPSAPVTGWLCAFWGWLALSLSWSQMPHVSTIFFVTISTMPVLFFAFVQSPRCDDFVRFCRIGVMVPVALLALSAIGQFFFLSDLVRDRINYPMLNPNNLAETLMMGIFLMLPLFVSHKSIIGKLIPGIVIALSVFAILMTQSRGGTLALLVGSAIFAVVCHRAIFANWKSFVILLTAIVTEWVVYTMTVYSRWGDSHLYGGGDAPEAVRVRYELWKAGWNMLKDYGFTGGAGLGTFYLTFPPYRELTDTSDGFFLHVDPIQFGIETGIPATILFYGFAAAVLIRTINTLRTKNVPHEISVPVICGFAGLLGLLINAHLDYPLYMVTSQIMAALFMASWYRGTEDTLDTARLNLTLRNRAHRILMVPLLAIILVILPGWIARAGLGVNYDALTGRALQTGDMASVSKYSKLSHLYSPESYDRNYMIDGTWRVRVLQQNFYNLDPDSRLELYQDAEKNLNETMLRNRYNVPAMTQQAMLHYIVAPRLDADGFKHAREILEEAIKLDPVSFEVRIALAKMYDVDNRPADAARILEGGLQYKLAQLFVPPAFYYMLAQEKQKIGDMAGAIEASRKGDERTAEINAGAEAQGMGVAGWVNQQINTLMGR